MALYLVSPPGLSTAEHIPDSPANRIAQRPSQLMERRRRLLPSPDSDCGGSSNWPATFSPGGGLPRRLLLCDGR